MESKTHRGAGIEGVMNEKAFCENCRTIVDYQSEVEEITVQLKGEVIVFDGTIIRCSICKEQIYVPAIEKINFKRFKVAMKANHETDL